MGTKFESVIEHSGSDFNSKFDSIQKSDLDTMQNDSPRRLNKSKKHIETTELDNEAIKNILNLRSDIIDYLVYNKTSMSLVYSETDKIQQKFNKELYMNESTSDLYSQTVSNSIFFYNMMYQIIIIYYKNVMDLKEVYLVKLISYLELLTKNQSITIQTTLSDKENCRQLTEIYNQIVPHFNKNHYYIKYDI